MFHWRDNIYFGRTKDGHVRVVGFSASPHAMWLHNDRAVTEPTNEPHADGEFNSVKVLFDLKIPAEHWASIIASVSAHGECDGGFYRALKFHNELVEFPEYKPAGTAPEGGEG